MALIVEDGSIVTGAESLLSVAEADTYHTARGNDAWTGDEAAKEAALRKATEYLQAVYGLAWQGYKTNSTQPLDWPRQGVIDRNSDTVAHDVVPHGVKRAVAELAVKALTADLLSDQSPAGDLRRTLTKVGPITTEKEYERGGAAQQKRYQFVEQLIVEFLSEQQITGGGHARTIPLRRA